MSTFIKEKGKHLLYTVLLDNGTIVCAYRVPRHRTSICTFLGTFHTFIPESVGVKILRDGQQLTIDLNSLSLM